MTNIVVNTTNINSVVNVTDLEVSVSVNVTNVESIVRVDYGLSDAPADGKIYGRKDGAWVEITQQASGITDILEGTNINIDKTDPENPIINVDETSIFTDTLITGLKSDADAGGEVPATLYNWFKSVYASLVDSSVKSWIIGIVTQLKWLTDNIGGGGYLLKYTVPADTNAISLTVDKNGQPFNFVEGDKIEIVAKFAFSTAAEPRLRLNNVISDVYRYGAFGFTSFGIVTIGRATFGGVIELTVLNNEVYGFSSIINETDTTRNTNTYALKTVGINQSAITSFQFFCSNASHQYLAGSQILIRKR